MSFHKKVFMGYILASLTLIVFGYFQLYVTDTAEMTDPDLAAYGAAKTLWPVITCFMTAVIAVVVYALRGVWMLSAWAYRKLV